MMVTCCANDITEVLQSKDCLQKSILTLFDFFTYELDEHDQAVLAQPVVNQKRTSQESNSFTVSYQNSTIKVGDVYRSVFTFS